LALIWGDITIPIMGILTTPIMGILPTPIIDPTITPTILTVIDGRPGCVCLYIGRCGVTATSSLYNGRASQAPAIFYCYAV